MRRASFLAAYILCVLAARPLHAASEALSGAGALAAKASVDFTLNVPRVMQMRLLGHPASLDITAEDIARGSITVSGPRLDLLVNDRLGYVLRAEVVHAVFTAAKIMGLPSTLVATPAGASVRMASMVGRSRPQPVAVEYELQLASDAQPGRYPWPVALTLQQP
jgi:hypothetical protein